MNFDLEKFLSELKILINGERIQGNLEDITAVGKFFMIEC